MNIQFYKTSKILKIIPLSFLSKITNNKTVFPFYHLVSDIDVNHVKHLYKVRSIKDFERDLDFFLKHYKPIDIHTYIGSINNQIKLNKNSFLLSFDDGLSEFYDIVAPILTKKGVPAISFLNSSFIDNKDLFFRYKASLLIEHILNSPISTSKHNELDKWFINKGLALSDVKGSILSISYQNKVFLDELAKLIEVDFNTYLSDYKPYMTTSQINFLIKQGFAFGAHSLDHPLYSDIDETAQLHQTKESIQDISTKFDLNYKLFSFPFTDYNLRMSLFDCLFDKTNPIADLTFGCAGLKHDSCPKNIQRIPIEIEDFTAQEVIYGEHLYFISKMILNKNKIKRI